VSVRFALGSTLYALAVPKIMRRAAGSGVAAVTEPVREMVEAPLAVRGWIRDGAAFHAVEGAGGTRRTWTLVLRRGLLSSYTVAARVGSPTTMTSTTVLGVGVSVVPSPDSAAVDAAEALLATE
jgi:hypothetical protein